MRRKRSLALRIGLPIVLLAAIGLLVASLDFRRDLHALRLAVLSGSAEGNYHALVGRWSRLVAKDGGRLENVASAGSVDNLRRLSRAARSCEIQFALIQAGQDWPRRPELELVGRLSRPESVFFLGRTADSLTDLASLANKKIGIGPARSGTAEMARQLFGAVGMSRLPVRLENHSLVEQLEQVQRGDLDLAIFVMDEDGPLIERAVRERGLQIAGFAHVGVLADRIGHLHVGRIAAGHYDPVRVLPPTDKPVLQVDTLVVGNGCASRSESVGLLTVLAREMPDFIRHNKGAPNDTGLVLSSASKSFFENDGPEIFDEWAPWLVDIMPPGKWVYLVTALSLLFNAMGFGHRFQLWRIDVARVRLEAELTKRFGATTTLGDIARLEPTSEHRTAERIGAVKEIIAELEALDARSRRQSLSFLVPMGQEMSYRYQESLIHETLAVLRAFVDKTRSP